MKKFIVVSMLGGFLWLLGATPTLAIGIGFNPASQTVGVGDAVDVDVVISGLESGPFNLGGPGEIVSAFDLDVTYDPTILLATGVTFGSLLGEPFFFEAFTDFDVTAPGVVDLAELSLLSDAVLIALQPNAFTLATLSFDAISPGTSPLAFVFDAFNDVKGLNAQVLSLDVNSGSVNVARPVPVPGTLLLLGMGLAGMAALKWKNSSILRCSQAND